MKIYKTQAEIEADIKDGVLVVDDSVTFECSFSIEASLKIKGDITAGDITARNITARNITARNITAGDITARNITARDITARDITAGDITARNITAGDITFYAVAFAYISFKCKSIVARRENGKYFCLDKEVEIKK